MVLVEDGPQSGHVESGRMFRLAQREAPDDARSLAAAIESSLKEVFWLPRGRQVVRVEPDDYPSLKSLSIDLSGAKIELDEPPPRPHPTGKQAPGPRAKLFELVGHPIRHQGAELDLELTARDVAFGLSKDRGNGTVLLLERAKDGRVEITIGRDDLEQLLLAAAQAAAANHGVTIKDVHVDLHQRAGQRDTVEAEVQVTARKVLSAVIHISGQLTIENELNIRLAKLSCQGEGVIGSMACGFLRPHLERLSGRQIPLMGFSLGEVRLRNLRIHVDDRQVQVNAEFGS